MLFLRQIMHLLMLLMTMHRARPADSLLIGAGFAIAAAALTLMLSIPAGIDRIAGATGEDNIMLALSSTAQDEVGSNLTPEQVGLISSLPQIERDDRGQPLIAPQFLASTKLVRSDGSKTSVLVRGVTSSTWKLIEGAQVAVTQEPAEGSRQLLAGRTLITQKGALDSSTIDVQGSRWDLIGSLDANGNLWESELWADMSALQAAYARSDRVSSLWLKLSTADDLPALQQAVARDPRLEGVRVISQTGYYRQQLGYISDFVTTAAIGISILLGSSAVLAISTTLGMALDKRRREMATLKAIGFNHTAIGSALLLDILIIGSVAAVQAILVVQAAIDGRSFGTSSTNQAVYAHFVVDAMVAVPVLVYSLALGLLSCAIPLRRIVRGPSIRQLTP